jgi:hypothetical protein
VRVPTSIPAARSGATDPLLKASGLFLAPFAAFLAYAWTGRRPERSAILAIAAANLYYVLGSIGLLSSRVEPTILGYAFAIAQAVVVTLVGELYNTSPRAMCAGLSWTGSGRRRPKRSMVTPCLAGFRARRRKR